MYHDQKQIFDMFYCLLESKGSAEEKEYNLQDNKEDMQVIDDVGASDGSVHNGDEEDILSHHSGSDFEEMSSVSGSFSRSRSRSLSSRSRSRSGSRASSGILLFVILLL